MANVTTLVLMDLMVLTPCNLFLLNQDLKFATNFALSESDIQLSRGGCHVRSLPHQDFRTEAKTRGGILEDPT